MIIKVRTHPVTIYYVTGDDAYNAHEMAGDNLDYEPCFVTDSFGGDGFAWDTPEAFEESWADDRSFDSYRQTSHPAG